MTTNKTIHAFTDDVLGTYDGVALATMIRDGKLSASEVTEAAIRRAQQVETSIHAIVCDDYERGRQRAQQKSTGAFAGVPTFVKDMTDVEGLPTRFGSEALHQSKPAKKTHRIAQQMIDMGMNPIGKSTMPDFGFTPSTEFPNGDATRNPWNLDRSAGGSSGGAAALVAAGVVPIANACDGGGSIRIPAACCGLVGLKPTRGRMPAAQAAEPFVGIVTDGVVTRSVRDTALFLSEVERLDPNPKLAPIGQVDRPLDRKLRIGMIAESPTGAPVDDAVQREFDASLQLLTSLGHEVVEMELPIDDQFIDDFITFWSSLAFLVAATGKFQIDPSFDKSRLTDVMQGLGKGFRSRWYKLPGTIMRLKKCHRAYSDLFNDIDLAVSPVLAHVTPEIGYLGMDLPFETLFPRVERWACFTPYANATGAPSLSLPLGFDGPTNTPIGIMFSADLGQEKLLLELALQLEQAAPWRSIADPVVMQN